MVPLPAYQRTLRLIAFVAVCAGSVADAQDVTLRLPVVDTFQVNTVVSVPDQGSLLLGSVGRAADGSSQLGFSPLGSSVGSERSHRSASASVYIHDFEALDAALLATPIAKRGPATTAMSPQAAHAYRALLRSGTGRRWPSAPG